MGIGLLILTIISVFLVVSYGRFYAFRLFMVIVGGVLVVFSYRVSLVPYFSIKIRPNRGNAYVSNKRNILLSFFFVFFVTTSVFMRLSISNLGIFSRIVYFSEDWAIASVWIGILLFIVIVFCTSVAGKYEGALCK
mgnify:CR=1 FL=1